MVSISKAYNDIARTKSMINKIHNERAIRYIRMAAPDVFRNPQMADREITTLSNLFESGTDEQGIINYLDYLLERTNPEVYRMKKPQEQREGTKGRILSASLQQQQQIHPWYLEIDDKILDR